MTHFAIWQISFAYRDKKPGFHPFLQEIVESDSAISALRNHGYPDAIGDKYIIEYNNQYNMTTKWVEACDINQQFWGCCHDD